MFFKKAMPAGPVEFLIVGLGNPGKKYEATRHNTGFIMLEALAEKLDVRVDRVQFKSLTGRGSIDGVPVLLMMPQTYMNNSGQAVSEAMRFYKIPPEKVLVMYDDIALPVGQLRLRRKGSSGGQKGMENILYLTGSDAFPRIRMGVGEKPHPAYDLADWVLSRYTPAEQKLVLESARNAAEAACMIVTGDMDGAMSRFSR